MTDATTAPEAPQSPAAADHAIVTRGLSKQYGRRFAVSDLSISIPKGAVAGFVGPNGAGKTTTIRMLLGLVRPTSGTAEVLGTSIHHPRSYLPRVGALIESPAFYPSLDGHANLKVLARLGGFSVDRIPALIDRVGLQGRGSDRVSGYSLGMKQRLGVAAALLPDPEILLLDEPANGLDPPGIIEMRELMRSLREEGKTIFVSSHLLGEVEQVADWLVVLKDGKSVFSGPTSDMLKASSGGIQIAPERAADVDSLSALLRENGFTSSRQNGYLLVTAPASKAGDLNRIAAKGGITLVEIHPVHATLEETFLTMISGKH